MKTIFLALLCTTLAGCSGMGGGYSSGSSMTDRSSAAGTQQSHPGDYSYIN
jgi:hypothetical protein